MSQMVKAASSAGSRDLQSVSAVPQLSAMLVISCGMALCVPNTVLSSCSKTRRVTSASLNQLVSAGEERRWHSNAKRLGGFHIDDQLETSWLLDRQIGGLGAFEDFVDVP